MHAFLGCPDFFAHLTLQLSIQCCMAITSGFQVNGFLASQTFSTLLTKNGAADACVQDVAYRKQVSCFFFLEPPSPYNSFHCFSSFITAPSEAKLEATCNQVKDIRCMSTPVKARSFVHCISRRKMRLRSSYLILCLPHVFHV